MFTNYCIALLYVIYMNLLWFLQIFTTLVVIALNLKKTHAYLKIRLNNFVIRCVNNWNLLNSNIVYSYSFTVQKRLLSFDKFTISGHALNVY